jgi:hypothetical protein
MYLLVDVTVGYDSTLSTIVLFFFSAKLREHTLKYNETITNRVVVIQSEDFTFCVAF